MYMSISVLAVLKKHYMRLGQCLPQDSTRTINKIKSLNQFLRAPDRLLTSLINLPTVDLINEAIVGLLMLTGIQSDIDALQFCDIMENLVDSKTDIEILRNGKLTSYVVLK